VSTAKALVVGLGATQATDIPRVETGGPTSHAELLLQCCDLAVLSAWDMCCKTLTGVLKCVDHRVHPWGSHQQLIRSSYALAAASQYRVWCNIWAIRDGSPHEMGKPSMKWCFRLWGSYCPLVACAAECGSCQVSTHEWSQRMDEIVCSSKIPPA